MIGTLPFIQKDDQALPDSYGITIYYVTGKKDEFELAQHKLNKDSNVFEFWTKEDNLYWIPMSSVIKIEFNKSFSKIIAIKEKLLKEVKNG